MNKFPSCRTFRNVEGVIIPAIIRNGRYFLIDISIFEDGVVDCWGSVDLPLFKAKLRRQWVVPKIPNGEVLHFSMMGDVQVRNANWEFSSPQHLFKHVKGIVRELNPSMINLYDMKGSSTYTPKGWRVPTPKLSSDKAQRFKTSAEGFFSRPLKGETFQHFMKESDDVYAFVNITLFEDDTVEIRGGSETLYISRSDFENRLNDGIEFAFPQRGARIVIQNLVNFEVGDVQWYIEENEIMGNFSETLRKLRGEPSLVTLCTDAFERYKKTPTTKLLDDLRTAYEAVPTHLRMFCGGQDEKDIPIRMALYGDKEIENWSHWQAAKDQGLTLPTIHVPKRSK